MRKDGRPLIDLVVATTARPSPNLVMRDSLTAYLQARSSPDQLVVIRDYTPVAVRLALEAHIRTTFLRAETGVSIQKALSTGLAEDGSMGYFNFDKRGLGEDLYLSDVYALVESLPGVDFLIVKEFRKQASGGAANLVNDVLRMPPDGVATGGDATDISIGTLAVHVGGRPGMSNLSQLESHYEELIYQLLPQLYRSRDSQGRAAEVRGNVRP